MISLSGLGSLTALNLVDATRDRQMAQIRTAPEHARGIQSFRERIAGITSAAELVADREVYTFVMKAFDLEDQIFGKALIRKALESEASERTSLINRLTDPRIKALHEELGFTANGTKNDNFARPAWQEKIVDRYIETAFINDQEVQNATVGFALEFRRKAADIENPFDILKDRGLTTVIQRALGLPEEISKLDIDRQAALVGRKLDIATLKDPEVVERLVRKYVILSDALDPGIASQNAAVRMLSATASQSTAPIALDLSVITRVPSTPYR